MYECDNNQMPYSNVKNFKKSKFENFEPLREHGLHWINFTIFTFICETNRYFKGLYKIWNKIISFDMRKKRWNVRQVMRKLKKKVNLGLLGMNP
jgi:hypothetical protein